MRQLENFLYLGSAVHKINHFDKGMQHHVEYEGSGWTTCRTCNGPVSKGSLRFRAIPENYSAPSLPWQCFSCWNPPAALTAASNLSGFAGLSPNDQSRLSAMVRAKHWAGQSQGRPPAVPNKVQTSKGAKKFPPNDDGLIDDPLEDTSAGIYVLRLKGTVGGKNCYYVGKANNKAKRIMDHIQLSSNSSSWVKHHGGVAAVEQPSAPPQPDLNAWELNETILRMIEHGFDCVRGWEWTSCSSMKRNDYTVFKANAFATADLCRRCGYPGHFVRDCQIQEKADWLQQCEDFEQGADLAEKKQQGSTASVARKSAKSLIGDAITKKGSTKRKSSAEPAYKRDAPAAALRGAKRGLAATKSCLTKPAATAVVKSNKRRKQGRVEGCERCGRDTHEASSCYAKKDIHGNRIEDEEEEDESSEEEVGCSRCGRDTHTKDSCYARKDVDGNLIEDEEEEDESSEEEEGCHRCGRDTHTADRCYAKKDVNGNWIGN